MTEDGKSLLFVVLIIGALWYFNQNSAAPAPTVTSTATSGVFFRYSPDSKPPPDQPEGPDEPEHDRPAPVPATATATPEQVNATANANANLRAGPGMQYAVVGGVRKGDVVDVVGLTGEWFELAGGVWIAARLVDNPPDVAPDDTTPLAPAPTIAPTAAPWQAVCSCSSNTYNCSAFPTHAAAQDCFSYCVGVGAGDIHWLDDDSDGIACELLP